MKNVLFILLLPVLLFGEIEFNSSIKNDLQAGMISRAEAVAYQLYAVTGIGDVPQRYAAIEQPVTRQTTKLLAEAKRLLQTAAPQQRALLEVAFTRPYSDRLPEKLISENGLFRLHYDTEGPNAAEEDFVRRAAFEFEQAYDFIVNELGYDPPPSDNEVDGPEWDVYIHNIGDYGYSTAENDVMVTERPFDYTSYIDIDNDFTHTYIKGVDALRVTAVHEFYHMVQIGYRSYHTTTMNAVWLFEAGATWMEDTAHPNVNDYVQYVSHYFDDTELPLYASDYYHEYGAGLFNLMLTKIYDRDLLRRVWENFVQQEALEAVEQTLLEYNTTLPVEVTRHAAWNMFTGRRADTTRFYSDGHLYPEVRPKEELNYPQDISFSGSISNLSYCYKKIYSDVSRSLSFAPLFEPTADWRLIVMNESDIRAGTYTIAGGGASMSRIIDNENPVWVIPVNVYVPSYYSLSKNNFDVNISEKELGEMETKVLSAFPNPYLPERHQDGIQFIVRIARDKGSLTARILDENGRIVYSQALGNQPIGDFGFTWDGFNNEGQAVTTGIYMLQVVGGDHIQPKKFAVIR